MIKKDRCIHTTSQGICDDHLSRSDFDGSVLIFIRFLWRTFFISDHFDFVAPRHLFETHDLLVRFFNFHNLKLLSCAVKMFQGFIYGFFSVHRFKYHRIPPQSLFTLKYLSQIIIVLMISV